MAQQTTYNLNEKVWTLLTDADVSAVTFQNLSGYDVWIAGTATTDPPATLAGAYRYQAGQGEISALMAELFPGVTGPVRLWAYSNNFAAVAVSHA